jgi:hypothetical protein
VNLHTCAPARNNPGENFSWVEVARTAWLAPSWREAAIAYHKDRPTSPAPSAGRLLPSEREIWRAAGQCIRRLGGHDALDTFRAWCRQHIPPSAWKRADAIFEMIAQKELSKCL